MPSADAPLKFDDGTLKLLRGDGLEYTAAPLQFHFHYPSENTVNGNYFDMEMHIVHLFAEPAADGSWGAVLGFFFNVGDNPSEFIENVDFT